MAVNCDVPRSKVLSSLGLSLLWKGFFEDGSSSSFTPPSSESDRPSKPSDSSTGAGLALGLDSTRAFLTLTSDFPLPLGAAFLLLPTSALLVAILYVVRCLCRSTVTFAIIATRLGSAARNSVITEKSANFFVELPGGEDPLSLKREDPAVKIRTSPPYIQSLVLKSRPQSQERFKQK